MTLDEQNEVLRREFPNSRLARKLDLRDAILDLRRSVLVAFGESFVARLFRRCLLRRIDRMLAALAWR